MTRVFSIAAVVVQSSLFHFPPLDQLLVLTKGKPTSLYLLIARLRAGNVLWFRNSFSEKERHLTRVQHDWMLWWCLRTSYNLIPDWDDVGLHGFHKRWKRSLFPAEKEENQWYKVVDGVDPELNQWQKTIFGRFVIAWYIYKITHK